MSELDHLVGKIVLVKDQNRSSEAGWLSMYQMGIVTADEYRKRLLDNSDIYGDIVSEDIGTIIDVKNDPVWAHLSEQVVVQMCDGKTRTVRLKTVNAWLRNAERAGYNQEL